MSGTLYVVATPIGNLEDITLRALRTLREVAIIAAEDTRRTAKLLNHHAIATRSISFHAHNTRARIPELLGRLRRGESVALVSDAGTPLLSDPGLELVQACMGEGIAVEPIPGASAVLAALVASGFPPVPATFYGFVPSRAKDRTAFLNDISAVPHSVVLFEAPHRIQTFLEHAGHVLGNRPLFVARELTKVHQEFFVGTGGELAKRLNNPRGELTVVIGPSTQEAAEQAVTVTDADLTREFRQLTESGGLTRRQALSSLAKRHGRPAREIFASLEAAKGTLP